MVVSGYPPKGAFDFKVFRAAVLKEKIRIDRA